MQPIIKNRKVWSMTPRRKKRQKVNGNELEKSYLRGYISKCSFLGDQSGREHNYSVCLNRLLGKQCLHGQLRLFE